MEHFTHTSLEEFVGSSYYARGRDYANAGRVLVVHHQNENMLRGSVKGRGRNVYTVMLEYESGEIIDSSCTCPMELDCKHVAAIGIQWLKKQEARLSGSKEVGTPQKFEPKNTSLKKDVASSTTWESNMHPMMRATSLPKKQLRVDLLIKVEPSFSPPTDHRPQERRVALRPRLCDPSSGWSSLTSLTWKDLQYHVARQDISTRAIQYLQLVRRAINTDRYYYEQNAWLHLHTNAAEALWPILTLHREYGVNLFFGQKGDMLAILRQEPISTRSTILPGKGDSLTLRSQLYIGDQRIQKGEAMIIGHPPAFALSPMDGGEFGAVMGIHPIEDPELIIAREEVTQREVIIPARDRDLFLQEYLPQMSAHYRVQSEVPGISIPQRIDPLLCISVSGTKETMEIHLEFSFAYVSTLLPLYHQQNSLVDAQGITMLTNPESEHNLYNFARKFFGNSSEFFEQTQDRNLKNALTLTGVSAADFVLRTVPLLQQEPCVRLMLHSPLPAFRYEDSEPTIEVAIEQSNRADWFDLGVTVTFGEEQVPMQFLIEALSIEQSDRLLLPSGNVVPITHPKLGELQKLLLEARMLTDEKKEGITLSRFQAGLWGELQKLGIITAQAEVWEKSISGLLNFQGLPRLRTSASIRSILRPYQVEGVRWLQFLVDNNLGGIMADDMGLGKTLQMIALLVSYAKKRRGVQMKDHRPSIVIAPTSVVESWDIELQKFAPTLQRVILRAGDRKNHLTELSTADVIVTSYALLTRDHAVLLKQDYNVLVIDEAQYVKNFQAKSYGLIRKMRSKSRFALTGTPMENSTIELWSILSIVCPGLFGSPEHFREHYQKPIERASDSQALLRLRSRVKPFLLRRTKEQVAKELPPKIEQVLYLDMPATQRKIYELRLQRERQRILGLLDNGGLKKHRFEVLESILRLRQICLHPVLADKKNRGAPSVKLEALLEQLRPIIAEHHRVLVFSQFTSFLSLVQELLDREHISYLSLNGSSRNRQDLVRRFQSEDGPSVFLISLKAGGVGLTLTAADYCILLDPWWNPAVEAQAVDRTHRIGQKKNVCVYRMIVRHTIEEKVFALQEKKRKLFRSIVDDGDLFASTFTEADIRGLLE